MIEKHRETHLNDYTQNESFVEKLQEKTKEAIHRYLSLSLSHQQYEREREREKIKRGSWVDVWARQSRLIEERGREALSQNWARFTRQVCQPKPLSIFHSSYIVETRASLPPSSDYYICRKGRRNRPATPLRDVYKAPAICPQLLLLTVLTFCFNHHFQSSFRAKRALRSID